MGNLQPDDVAIASQPNNLARVPCLLAEINAELDHLLDDADSTRQSLLAKCRSLVQALEMPRETMPSEIAALTFGVDCGLWARMAQNGDKAQAVAELAAELGVDPALLNEYTPTNYSKSMSIPAIGNGYFAMLSCMSAGLIKFHEYSRRRGWKNPTDASDTPVMYAYGTDKNVFSWLHDNGYDTHFSDHLVGCRAGIPPWMSTASYPVRERLIEGATSDPGAAFLVDIGGNIGQNLSDFKRAYPDAPGKLILQDLPVVINRIKQLDPSIVRMGYDFSTEQPIKGARAYYLHFILHDWPDEVCETILSRIKEAMRPGYSRLLINEIVMPVVGAYWEATALDIMMMSQLCAQERTIKAWRQLVEKVGLTIVQVWHNAKAVESVIECEVLLPVV
ncbi:hypothetical protein NQ176_g1534 [Zarea fungicola]|uniref:Uncharacterized protein n=1 Tax=Zarea fungicola TaxID=93591 RepID=A0ACC1NUI2_9HYPO|nr:hypothetical protein NQ176_g1534 [Lecanicillium fungicola]